MKAVVTALALLGFVAASTVPVVASLRPVRRMVFLGAMVPAPGEVYREFLATQPGALTAASEPASPPPIMAMSVF